MMINSATANSLGEKLAGLNLTAEEGDLLASLLGAPNDDDIDRFGHQHEGQVDLLC